MSRGLLFWSGVVSGGLTLIQDLVLLKNGKINNRELGVHTTRNVTETVGSIAGIEYGAVLGTSVLPGVGTVIGGVVGYFVGSRLGHTVGNTAGNMLFPTRYGNNELDYQEKLLLQNQPH